MGYKWILVLAALESGHNNQLGFEQKECFGLRVTETTKVKGLNSLSRVSGTNYDSNRPQYYTASPLRVSGAKVKAEKDNQHCDGGRDPCHDDEPKGPAFQLLREPCARGCCLQGFPVQKTEA